MLPVIGAAAVAWYVALTILLGFMWSGYDPLRDTQSELGAADSPYRGVMNIAGFMVLGLAIIACAIAYRCLLRPSRARAIGTVLLFVAGLSMTAVGFIPCDAGCVDVTATGRAHSLVSAVPAVCLPIAAMASAGAFSRDGRPGLAWRHGSFVLGLATLATGPLIATGGLDRYAGLVQRIGMWPALVWLAATTWRLRGLADPAEPDAPGV